MARSSLYLTKPIEFGILALLVGTLSPPSFADAAFNLDVCKSSERKTVLCFDLRDDSHPTAGVVLSISNADGKDARIILPFKTTDFAPDENVLATWGSYNGFTVLTYAATTPGTYGIGFLPVFDASSDSLDDRRGSGGSLSFVRLGLERRFVYRHRLNSYEASFPRSVSQIGTQPLDAIGVARPATATGLELSSGRVEDPPAFGENGRARFYAPVDVGGKPNRIEIRYQVQPTSTQTLLLTYLSKVAGALAAPFIAIFFFSVKDNIRPRTRIIVLYVFGLVQAALFVWLVVVALSARNDAATSAIADWILVVVSAGAAWLPLWIKREPPTNELKVRP